MIELALNAAFRTKYQSVQDWAGRAASVARPLGDLLLTEPAGTGDGKETRERSR